MNSIKKMVSVTAILAMLTMLVLSFHAPLAHADAGGIVLNIGRATTVNGGMIQFDATLSLNSQGSQTLYPDGTVVRIHVDASFSSAQSTPSKPGSPVYCGDISATLINHQAAMTLACPYVGAGYYLFVVSAYAPDGTLLASGWIDPAEGTAG